MFEIPSMYAEPTWIIFGPTIAVLLVAFTSGWCINGWRWNYAAPKPADARSHTQINAEEKFRNQKLALQAATDNARNIKNVEIKRIRCQRDTALVSLRERPLRVANVPVAGGACPPATGAQLSCEDAGFLAREVARADQVVSKLVACQVTYDAARDGNVPSR